MASKFKYVGDPNDNFSGPESVEQYGLRWVKGEVVSVPDQTEAEKENVRRLQGNSHFTDMSDKDQVRSVADRQKAIEQREADEAKAAEEQRKRDERDEAERQKNLRKAAGTATTADTAPRPPGTVTRPPVNDAFGGRTVEERTVTEDHTKAGKTKS